MSGFDPVAANGSANAATFGTRTLNGAQSVRAPVQLPRKSRSPGSPLRGRGIRPHFHNTHGLHVRDRPSLGRCHGSVTPLRVNRISILWRWDIPTCPAWEVEDTQPVRCARPVETARLRLPS